MTFHTFPSIGQYRNAIKNVGMTVRYKGKDADGAPILDYATPLPTIRYRGTVKLHGTNAAIVLDCQSDELSYQSRERLLTLEHDNSLFMLMMQGHVSDIRRIIAGYLVDRPVPLSVALFGEWCGTGIQQGVAISELPRMFVIFAVKFYYEDHQVWLPLDPENIGETAPIYCIEQFPYFELDIDFRFAEVSQQALVEITEDVERECPVAKHFGISGVGEGVVWRPIDKRWLDSDFWFKVKGEKHSASKVKTLAAVDPEVAAGMRDFVESVTTEQRFLQGIHWLKTEALKPLDMTSMGDFIRWVFGDIMKEESDVIVASTFDPKKLGRPISDACRSWFVQYINTRELV